MIRENHRRFIRFLSDVLLLSACCLFLISIVEPFLTSNLILPRWYQLPVETEVSVTYGSYKAVVYVDNFHERFFFNDYWFGNYEGFSIVIMDIPMFLIIMFTTQILTIALGLLSLGLRKEMTRLISFILSAIVILLMYKTCTDLNDGFFSAKFEAGYWLTYPSLILFLLASILSLLSHKRQAGSNSQELTSLKL